MFYLNSRPYVRRIYNGPDVLVSWTQEHWRASGCVKLVVTVPTVLGSRREDPRTVIPDDVASARPTTCIRVVSSRCLGYSPEGWAEC